MSFPREEIGRRTFLRGLGACITLPGMISLAGGVTLPGAGSPGLTATGAPLRTAYLYVPNGVIMDKWRPEGFGADFKFNESMAPLENFRNDLQIVKGFAQVEGNPGKDGAGDHEQISKI